MQRINPDGLSDRFDLLMQGVRGAVGERAMPRPLAFLLLALLRQFELVFRDLLATFRSGGGPIEPTEATGGGGGGTAGVGDSPVGDQLVGDESIRDDHSDDKPDDDRAGDDPLPGSNPCGNADETAGGDPSAMPDDEQHPLAIASCEGLCQTPECGGSNNECPPRDWRSCHPRLLALHPALSIVSSVGEVGGSRKIQAGRGIAHSLVIIVPVSYRNTRKCPACGDRGRRRVAASGGQADTVTCGRSITIGTILA